MVNSSAYINARKEILKKFIKDEYKFAADVGCGTGNDSIALALNGLQVIGFEPSAEMLHEAVKKTAAYGCHVGYVNKPASKITKEYNHQFDFVISLGNTLANINPPELKKSLYRIHAILKKGGTLLLQILNYGNLRKENRRIVNVTESGGKIFFRFYDFLPGRLDFNILTAEKENLKNHNLITTRLYEYTKSEVTAMLKTAGFKSLKYYADFNQTPFSASSSKDLIITASK